MRVLGKLSTATLVIYLGFGGIIIGCMWMITRKYLFAQGSPINFYDVMMLSLAFLIEGLIGLVFIIKKEALQIIRLKGNKAVVLGILILGWSWLIIMYIIFYYYLRW